MEFEDEPISAAVAQSQQEQMMATNESDSLSMRTESVAQSDIDDFNREKQLMNERLL